MTARSHTAQRNALSQFECCPSEMGHEMRAAFLCLQEKCHHIFSIPPQTVDSGVTQSSAPHTPFIDSYPLSLRRAAQHVVGMSTMEPRSPAQHVSCLCHSVWGGQIRSSGGQFVTATPEISHLGSHTGQSGLWSVRWFSPFLFQRRRMGCGFWQRLLLSKQSSQQLSTSNK